MRSLPARNVGADNNNMNSGVGLGGGMNANAEQQSESPLTPEEQVALIELQRAKAIKEHDPIQNLFPPTELTSEITGKPTQGGPPGF